MGGGITSINAEELSQICQINSNDTSCQLTKTYSEVTNNGTFAGYIRLSKDGGIDTFINYGDITDKYKNYTDTEYTLSWDLGYISNVINYGTMGGLSGNRGGVAQDMPVTITNYGKMKGINTAGGNADIIIDNYGVIYMLWQGATWYHLSGGNYDFVLKNYAITIQRDSNTFNTGVGRPDYEDNSHLIVKGGKIRFQDANSKIILDFGENFEFGKEYSLNRLIMDTGYWAGGTWKTVLPVEFYRLTTQSDIYYLTQRGDNFIVNRAPQYGKIGTLYKANIRTMNNFHTMSNSMIYPRKSYNLQNLGKKNLSFIDSTLDFAIPIKSYESFSYRNESVNRRIQRQNKRNYSRKSQNQTQNLKENQRDSQNLNADSVNQTNSSLRADSQNLRGNPQTQTFSQNLAQSPNYSQTPHNYYFILTPFFNYNSFAKSGNYNLSGFDYGFLTAFSTQVAESNHLGAHFIFSYGSLGDSKDKDLSIKSLNLNVGLNYKLDLIYDMYLKARGDFFYFLNQVKTLTMFEVIKPNNLGFGVSVIFGKDFDFKQGGILGIEAGIDYKALQSSTISLQNNATKTISETYQKALYNLIYVDLGMSYNKYFGNFGLNAMLGIKGNITANKLATSKIHISSFNKSVDMVLDNDNFLGYANLGVSYVMNAKNFDMEFSLAYYGNFGDRVISNGGGVEFRVGF